MRMIFPIHLSIFCTNGNVGAMWPWRQCTNPFSALRSIWETCACAVASLSSSLLSRNTATFLDCCSKPSKTSREVRYCCNLSNYRWNNPFGEPGPYCIAAWAAYRVIRRAQPETSAQRLVENLQRQVSRPDRHVYSKRHGLFILNFLCHFARLEDENQRLRSDLLAAGVEVEEDQTKEADFRL